MCTFLLVRECRLEGGTTGAERYLEIAHITMQDVKSLLMNVVRIWNEAQD